jgi:hypothetical protein
LDKLNNITYTQRSLGDGSNGQGSRSSTATSNSADNFAEAALNTAAALAFVALVIAIAF